MGLLLKYHRLMKSQNNCKKHEGIYRREASKRARAIIGETTITLVKRFILHVYAKFPVTRLRHMLHTM